jgi:hypothetical protein
MISSAEFWQYAGVFGALVAAAFGAPIPEEIPIATGGVMVARAWVDPATLPPGEAVPSGLKWWIMLPLCIVGVVLCDAILYGIGTASEFCSSRGCCRECERLFSSPPGLSVCRFESSCWPMRSMPSPA